MSLEGLHILNYLNPFFKTLRRNVMRWTIHILFFILVLVVHPIAIIYFGGEVSEESQTKQIEEKSSTTWIAIAFTICLLIILILSFKNIKKNALLRATISEYDGINKIDLFTQPYKKICFYSRLIFLIDLVPFLGFPLSSPLKFVLWINYRKLKKSFKRLRKMVHKGERVLQNDSIENDPFYEFLMREGLYETKMPAFEEMKEGEKKQFSPLVKDTKNTTMVQQYQ